MLSTPSTHIDCLQLGVIHTESSHTATIMYCYFFPVKANITAICLLSSRTLNNNSYYSLETSNKTSHGGDSIMLTVCLTQFTISNLHKLEVVLETNLQLLLVYLG